MEWRFGAAPLPSISQRMVPDPLSNISWVWIPSRVLFTPSPSMACWWSTLPRPILTIDCGVCMKLTKLWNRSCLSQRSAPTLWVDELYALAGRSADMRLMRRGSELSSKAKMGAMSVWTGPSRLSEAHCWRVVPQWLQRFKYHGTSMTVATWNSTSRTLDWIRSSPSSTGSASWSRRTCLACLPWQIAMATRFQLSCLRSTKTLGHAFPSSLWRGSSSLSSWHVH